MIQEDLLNYDQWFWRVISVHWSISVRSFSFEVRTFSVKNFLHAVHQDGNENLVFNFKSFPTSRDVRRNIVQRKLTITLTIAMWITWFVQATMKIRKLWRVRLHTLIYVLVEVSGPWPCPVGGGCRIHRLHRYRGARHPYDTKQSDGEVPVMLELWGMRNTPSLPVLQGPLWPGMVVVPDRALSMG